jgi:hypothetical protein
VLVRFAETAQVRDDHIGGAVQRIDHIPPVAVVAGPAVQQDDGIARTVAFIGQREAVKRCRAQHPLQPIQR